MAGSGTTLIVAEKPSSAQKIAQALAEGNIATKVENKVPYYIFSRNNNSFIAIGAAGHLFGLNRKEVFPYFELDWVESYKVNKEADFTENYVKAIKKQAQGASDFVIATDFDTEGEVIGLNILRFLCKKEDAKRMKFSALTKKDLVESFENILPTLNWGQAEAGLTRHYVDFFYGINLSKTVSDISRTREYNVLSIGRVQGPTLKILSKREKEIASFVATKYWQLLLTLSKGKDRLNVVLEKRYEKKDEADLLFKKIQGKDSIVIDVRDTDLEVSPPIPFDLTSLQMEAYKLFRFSPKEVLGIAQELYNNAYISYPRTSSQKLPVNLNYRDVFLKLGEQSDYYSLSGQILKQSKLIPTQGKKTDPAHPAIYPTGEKPDRIEGRQKKLYDLIVKRFYSVFGPLAILTERRISFEIDGVKEVSFSISDKKIKDAGWIYYYHPYYRLNNNIPEVFLSLRVGERVSTKAAVEEKLTEPPKRYSQASLVKLMEKLNVGTKATRAGIIDTLYKRKYVDGDPIKVTELGLAVSDVFSSYAPELVSVNLTRKLEGEMEEVFLGKIKREKVLEDAKKIIIRIIEELKNNKEAIRDWLLGAIFNTKKSEKTLMKCPVCKEGDFIIRFSKAGKRFLACNRYPDCQTTWSLPQFGGIKFTDKLCPDCKTTPLTQIIQKGKRPWTLCLNPTCPSKAEYLARKAKENTQKSSGIPGKSFGFSGAEKSKIFPASGNIPADVEEKEKKIN